MKAVEGRLFKRLNREQIECEIEEELRLHLELLTDEHLQQDLSLTEARNAALKRFGNVEQIKDQCVEISSSSRPSIRALKSFLILVFLLGVLVRHLLPLPETGLAENAPRSTVQGENATLLQTHAQSVRDQNA